MKGVIVQYGKPRFEEKRVEELLRVIRSTYAQVVNGAMRGGGEREALDGMDEIHRAAESLLKRVPP